jgi:two-component system phosphate regulon sensor histidine kinase PhoR
MMFLRTFSWRMFSAYLVIILVSLMAVSIFTAISLRQLHGSQHVLASEGVAVSHGSHDVLVKRAYQQIAAWIIAVAAVALVASFLVARRIGNPMAELRRQFVANVSHELRTPITSIKGFVETLQDGAMNDPEDAERFLKILARQTDRLNAIVEDLLTLSSLDEDGSGRGIIREDGPIGDVLENAVQVCEVKAAAKQIEVHLRCGDHLVSKINAPLLEQAVVNLVDNAIKYGPDGSIVHVEARAEKGDVVIHVRDSGDGIDAQHLSRLFERFYRVDEARSRELGGTGLGLAITKHIVGLHRGRVHVESAKGQGSTFSIYLPRK